MTKLNANANSTPKPTYIVGSEANDLEGWTPETLAEALRIPLGKIGVLVECQGHTSGHPAPDPLLVDNDLVKTTVERVVEGYDAA